MKSKNKSIERGKVPQEASKNTVTDGLCPVCWGTQEYDGKIKVLVKDKQIEINNHLSKDMMLKAFVKENIDGKHLQEGAVQPCPVCSEKNSLT